MRRGLIRALAIGVCLSVFVLTWFGYQSVQEWRRSSRDLLHNRADEAATLLVRALTRDMYEVQRSALTSEVWDDFSRDSTADVRNAIAKTFARYPYPEAFFAWRAEQSPPDVVFFLRSDRRPPWALRPSTSVGFPVAMHRQPAVASMIVKRLQADQRAGRTFSAFGMSMGAEPYQVIARLFYSDRLRQNLSGVLGFVVNMSWVRTHYVVDLTRQVARFGPTTSDVTLTITDQTGVQLATAGPTWASADADITAERTIGVLFLDPRLIALDPPADLPSLEWKIRALAPPDPLIAGAIRSATRVLLVSALTVVILAAGLVLTAQAGANLTQLRSDFVSSVTHELKAPIATIRAASGTLVSGKIVDPERQRHYARIVLQASKRLSRLVDNLLAFSRVTDIAEVYSFEPLDPRELVDHALSAFSQQLRDEQFEVIVDVPDGLPRICGDRVALQLMLDNIVDNAIRYSDDNHYLRIGAAASDGHVNLAITDRGAGIPQDEIDKVTLKFVRGRTAPAGGTGLGMAIVKRIVADHSGHLSIQSAVNAGTIVTVSLPKDLRA